MFNLNEWNDLWSSYLKRLRLEHVFTLSEDCFDFLHGFKIHDGARFVDPISPVQTVVTYGLVFTRNNDFLRFFKTNFIESNFTGCWTNEESNIFFSFSENEKNEIIRTLNLFPFEEMILQKDKGEQDE